MKLMILPPLHFILLQSLIVLVPLASLIIPARVTFAAPGTSESAELDDGLGEIGNTTTESLGASAGLPPIVMSLDFAAIVSPNVGTITATKNGPGQYYVKRGDEFTSKANFGNIRITGIEEAGSIIVIAQFDNDPGIFASAELAAGAADPNAAQLAFNYGFVGPSFRIFKFGSTGPGERFLNFDLPTGVNLVRAIAVPEPAVTGLLAMGVTCSLRRRRKRYSNC